MSENDQTTVRMKRNYHAKVKALAKRSGRNIMAQLEHILDLYFANRDVLERSFWRDDLKEQ